jgi:hypothetical protein
MAAHCIYAVDATANLVEVVIYSRNCFMTLAKAHSSNIHKNLAPRHSV